MKKRLNPDLYVRGHHFSQLQVMLSRQMYARTDTSPDVMAIARATELTNRASYGLQSSDREARKYGVDLLGKKAAHKEQFYKQVRIGFLKFLLLPETAWICLNTNLDWICNACSVGEHCNGLQEYDADIAALEYLQTMSESLSIPHYVTIQQIAKGMHEHTIRPVAVLIQKLGLRQIVLESDEILKIRYNRLQNMSKRRENER